ncbi:hypothetical protein [Marinicella litoralis]|uniref:Uncharacterized protein n=1 Tax=Marinicella litoralis TaxID=644220 RepID=A0A4R6XFX7_9GAMM|nr:hypothetical protein [Marinicella litoralis]TDR18272.1 hypothetical protein C8D91_2187 [Marinicella litoralis]
MQQKSYQSSMGEGAVDTASSQISTLLLFCTHLDFPDHSRLPASAESVALNRVD